MSDSDRTRREPEVIDDDTIRLWGVGPECPGCGGPTHCVTGDDDAEHPWWCSACTVRLDDDGGYGAAADFPAGSEPDQQSTDADTDDDA